MTKQKEMQKQGLVVTSAQLRKLADRLDDDVRETDKKVASILRTKSKLGVIRHLVPIVNRTDESDKWTIEGFKQLR